MRRTVAAAVVGLGLVATACTSAEEGPAKEAEQPDFAFLSDARLATSNAASAWGEAVGAAQLASRVYPALYLPGPAGQMIPNSDLAQVEYYEPDDAHPGAHVDVTLTEQARFSDGTPVTCDDYLLSYTAGILPTTFGSHMPLAGDIAQLECAPQAKRFSVWFNPGAGARWRHLFGPGTVLPAHAVAQRAGMSVEDLNAALHTQDPTQLGDVAKTWREGFSTEPGHFDPELQVSFGPYSISRVEDSGAVILEANPEYYGDKPELEQIVMWPDTADADALVAARELRVAEAPVKSPGWVDRNAEGNPFEITSAVGALTDTLTFSDAGVFAQPWARQAFAACVDTAALAKASSEASGVEVPAVSVRTVRHDDPVAAQVAAADAAPAGAAEDLGGTTVGVGYLGPNPRLKKMVEQLRTACAPAGITVEDRSGSEVSRGQLAADPATGLPGIDIYLGPVDPLNEYSAPAASVKNAKALREEEKKLWEELPSIPVAAQPRNFVVDRAVSGVVPYTGPAGIGWNLERWSEARMTSNTTNAEAKEES